MDVPLGGKKKGNFGIGRGKNKAVQLEQYKPSTGGQYINNLT